MKVSLIVAMDLERGIGKNNDLMWHLHDDMMFFKKTTQGHVVVTGRKNYESIPEKYRPLPNRENVILTKNSSYQAPGAIIVNSLEECLEMYKQENERTIFIIGGGEIYRLAYEAGVIEEMYITHVNGTFGADTYFPKFDLSDWNVSTVFSREVDERHDVSFTVMKYTRK